MKKQKLTATYTTMFYGYTHKVIVNYPLTFKGFSGKIREN